jgi:hypothetical protein
MPTVLCLGGTGQFGLPTARHLAADAVVDRVIVAGRDLAKAQAAAATLGPKAIARQVDADDDASLAVAMNGVSVVISSLWQAEGRAARVMRAAVAAGAHYVELTDNVSEAPGADLDAAAQQAGVALLWRVGADPGVTDLCERHLLDALDEPQVLLTMQHWPRLLDCWTDLFDTYVELPGGRRRGPLGRRLAATLTAAERDPAAVAAVLRDACVVPFFLTLIGNPGRWLATVPDLRDGQIVDVDALTAGFDASLWGSAARRERPLVATERPAQTDGIRRVAATVTGMSAVFDDALRTASRRVAAGGALEAEVAALEAAVARDPSSYLRPAAEVAALPAWAFNALGRHAGAPARASVVLPDELFVPERYLDFTAAAVAVTVRYLLDGTVDTRGAATMALAVRDAERFGRDYLALMGPELAGLDLYSRRVVPA